MANEISLVTASGRTVTPKDDGIIYEVFSPGNGIIYGGAVTIKDSSTLHITAGHGIVCGRKFTIDDSDIPVTLSGSGSLLGRLYIHLDLADAADPITLLVETGASLTPVVQNADVNINNGVYEINIATFDVDTSTISNLVNIDVTVAPMGDMEGATSLLDGKGGYVPAPQAGDEDKVLRGDGTWGSAGDTATVRYDKTTKYIQLLDDNGWFNWKKAGREVFNAIDDSSIFTINPYGAYTSPTVSVINDILKIRGNGSDIVGTIVIAPQAEAYTVHYTGYATFADGSGRNVAFGYCDALRPSEGTPTGNVSIITRVYGGSTVTFNADTFVVPAGNYLFMEVGSSTSTNTEWSFSEFYAT